MSTPDISPQVSSVIAAIGEQETLRGFALAGVSVIAAEDAETVRAVWHGLAKEVGLVILTPAAHAALQEDGLDRCGQRLWAVMHA